jgi:hypothetical protein
MELKLNYTLKDLSLYIYIYIYVDINTLCLARSLTLQRNISSNSIPQTGRRDALDRIGLACLTGRDEHTSDICIHCTGLRMKVRCISS